MVDKTPIIVRPSCFNASDIRRSRCSVVIVNPPDPVYLDPDDRSALRISRPHSPPVCGLDTTHDTSDTSHDTRQPVRLSS